MTCPNGTSTGYDIGLFVAYSCPSTQPAEAAYKQIGMLRGKEFAATNSTSETTGDSTVGRQKTYAVTTVEYTGSFDGVSYSDTQYNQEEFYLHCMFEGHQVNTVDRGYVWAKLVYPQRIIEGPFIVTSFTQTASNEEAVTFKFELQAAGGSHAITVTPV